MMECEDCGGRGWTAQAGRTALSSALVSLGILAWAATPVVTVFKGPLWALAAIAMGSTWMVVGLKNCVKSCPRCRGLALRAL